MSQEIIMQPITYGSSISYFLSISESVCSNANTNRKYMEDFVRTVRVCNRTIPHDSSSVRILKKLMSSSNQEQDIDYAGLAH